MRCVSASGSPVSMNGNIVARSPSVGLFWLSIVREAVRVTELVSGGPAEVDRARVRVAPGRTTVKRKPLLVLR